MATGSQMSKQLKTKVENILEDYASFVLEHKRIPTGNELKDDFDVTRKAVEHHFGNYERLMKAALKAFPKAFTGVFLPEDFSSLQFENLKKQIRKHKRFVITTAVCGAKVNENFYKSLQNYCKKTKALLLIMPSGADLVTLDPKLKGEAIVTRELFLNSNIKLDPVLLNPKVIRPMSGLNRIGGRSTSTIFAAPKLTKESVATDTGKYPHIIMTTGAITDPSYADLKKVMKKKVDHVAEYDHDLACIIIETADDVFFHEREMQADLDGSVVDFTMRGPMRYLPNGKITKAEVLNFNVPDWHCFETSEFAYSLFPKMAAIMKPKSISLHDVTSVLTHTHHTKGNKLISAQIEESGIEPVAEIQMFADDLNMWLKSCDAQIYIVGSNHPEHLIKAVAEGTLDTPSTWKTYLELALAMINGHDPLQWGLKHYAQFKSNRVTFLGRDDRHVEKSSTGHEIAFHFHGDKSANGAKNSGESLGIAVAVGTAVINHSHSPRIMAGGTLGGRGPGSIWVGGTSTVVDGPEKPHYALGCPSSWLQTATITYKGARFLRQQITLVGGTFCLDSGTPKRLPDVRAKKHTQIMKKLAAKRVRGIR
jgi:hypothetical protein